MLNPYHCQKHTFYCVQEPTNLYTPEKAPILIIETLRTQFYHRLFIYFHENLKLTQIPSLFQSFYIILIFVTIGCTKKITYKTQKIYFKKSSLISFKPLECLLSKLYKPSTIRINLKRHYLLSCLWSWYHSLLIC